MPDSFWGGGNFWTDSSDFFLPLTGKGDENMAIYTEEQIDRNKLYNEVMQDINDLYSRHGDPVEFET